MTLAGRRGRRADREVLRDYLLENAAASRSEIRLDVILQGIRFDARLTDPCEKVGRVFQFVDKKKLARTTWRSGAVPRKRRGEIYHKSGVRERIEFEISTEEGRQYARSLRMLHAVLVDKFSLWYRLYSMVQPARTPPRMARESNVAARTSPARGGCFKYGPFGLRARLCPLNRGAADRSSQHFGQHHGKMRSLKVRKQKRRC